MPAAERVRQEIREIGLVTLYFLACFLFFLFLKKLLLDEYKVEIAIVGTAVVGALVIAKVVILVGKTSMGERFASDRVLLHVLWRTGVYTAIVLAVTLLERLFDLYRESGELPKAAAQLWAGEDFDHFMAMNLCVGLSLLAYNLFGEIERHMGEGALRDLFLSRRRSSHGVRD